MNEINRLYNEYELKQLTIRQIANIHKRTDFAILNKLEQEKLIDSTWNNVRGWDWPDNSNFDNYIEKKQHENEEIDDENEEIDDENEEIDDDNEELDDDNEELDDEIDDENYEYIVEEPSSDEDESVNGNNLTTQLTTFLELVDYFKKYLPSNVKKSDHFTSPSAV
jgi:hypothetical protein